MIKNKKGFTLIELLIVVAIIAILAAIAIPNFLQAQIRSKISRVKADMRSIATGVESYAVDNNEYPYVALPLSHFLFINYTPSATDTPPAIVLSTPISYITSIPIDPFGFSVGGDYAYPLRYCAFNGGFDATQDAAHGCPAGFNQINFKYHGGWVLGSAGPDKTFNPTYSHIVLAQDVDRILYDPTNGTISNGDILRSQGGKTPNQ